MYFTLALHISKEISEPPRRFKDRFFLVFSRHSLSLEEINVFFNEFCEVTNFFAHWSLVKVKSVWILLQAFQRLCLLRVTWVLLAWVATPPVAGPLKVSTLGGEWQVLPPVTSTRPSIQSRAARSFEVIFSVLSSRSSRTAHVWIRFVGRSVLCACHKMVDVICADVNELESRDVFEYPVCCGHTERDGRVELVPLPDTRY